MSLGISVAGEGGNTAGQGADADRRGSVDARGTAEGTDRDDTGGCAPSGCAKLSQVTGTFNPRQSKSRNSLRLWLLMINKWDEVLKGLKP